MSSGFSRRGRGPYERSGGQGREGGRHPSGLSGKDIGMYYRDRSQAKKKDKEKNEVGFGTSGFNIDNRVNERDRKRKSRLKNASCRISRSLVSYEKIVKFPNFSLDHLQLLYLRTLLSAISLFIPEYFCLQIITQEYERRDLLV